MSDHAPRLAADLRRKAAGGVLWSSLSGSGQRLFSFAILLVLTRLLSVEEFGTVALAAGFVTLLSVAAQGGLYAVVIQRPDLTERQKNTAFFTSLVLGTATTAIVTLAAKPIALLFGAPAIEPVLRLLSLLFVLRALTCVHEALIVKRFGFRALAVRSLAATLLAGAIAILLAWRGWGVYSLVFQQLTQAVISLVVIWNFSRWRPGLSLSRADAGHMLVMGTKFMLAGLLARLNTTVPLFAVGFVLGTEAAGLFRLAWTGLDLCIQITIRSFTTVAFPIFSQLQNDPPRLSQAFVQLTRHCAALTFPLFLGATALAPQIVILAFGAKWAAAGEVLRVLALIVLPATVNFFVGPALGALGRPQDNILISVVQVALAIGLSVLTAPFGVVAVAAGHVLRAVLTTPVGFWLLHRQMRIDIGQTARNLAPPLAAASVMAGVVMAAEQAIGPAHAPLLVLAALVPLGALVYLCALLLLDRRLVASAFQILRGFLPRARKRAR